ncbi:uncharacterized protein LOC120335177 isoform X1 [Styela clava]
MIKCLRYRVGIYNYEDDRLIYDHKTEKKISTTFQLIDLNLLCYIKVECLYPEGKYGVSSKSSTITPLSNDICKKTIPNLQNPTMSADDPFVIRLQWHESDLAPKKYLIQTIKDGKLLNDEESIFRKRELKIYCGVQMIGSTYQFMVTGIFENYCRGISAISTEIDTAKYDFTSVRNLQAGRDERNPFHIALKWDPPKCPPMSYTINLYKDDVIVRSIKERQKCDALFSNLEENTAYSCSVIGIYRKQKHGTEIKSSLMSTANKMDTAPTNFEAIASNKNPFQVRLRWDPPIVKPPEYIVRIFCGETKINSLTTKKNEAVFGGLKQNTEYFCTVVGMFEGFKNDFIMIRKSDIVTTGDDKMLAPISLRWVPSNREVTITWDLPDNHCQLMEYICQLLEEEKPFTTKTVIIDSVSFSELRNGYNYRCIITAVYKNAHKAHTTLDHVRINTQRNKSFNIGQKGKPINISCKASAKDNTLLLLVKWENGDIGQEAVNFKKMKSTIKLFKRDLDKVGTADDNWEMQDFLEVEYSITECSYKNLLYGKEYRVQISTRYMDLDSKGEKIAENFKLFSTGVDTAKNLKIEWKNNQIIAKWDEALGAKSYELNIFDCGIRKKYLSFAPTTNTWTFNMTANCRYGQNRNFQLIGKCLDTASVPSEKQVTIGGNYVPTNVELKPSPDDTNRQLSASWTAPVEIPLKYYIQLIEDNQIVDKIETEETTFTFTGLKPGSVYTYNISAYYANFEDTVRVWSNNCFTTRELPKIHSCTWEQGIVTFSWNSVKGANYYTICLMDEHLEETIISNQKVDHESVYRAEMMGELRMGKSCMMKVTVYDEIGQSVSTDWTPQRIGDPKAPRNVKATKNRQISRRCMNIKFDRPIYDKSPSKYRVEAIPNTGRIKAMVFSSEDQIIFTHLRRGTEYTFVVYAVYEGEESEGSLSNIVSISGEPHYEFSTMKFNQMQGGNFKIGTVHAPGEVNITHNHPDGPFGTPLDIKYEITSTQKNCEECEISWQPPSFNQRRNDFKIYHFNIRLERQDGYVVNVKKTFSEKEMTYDIRFTLEKGWEYDAYISTVFEDIDRDEDYISPPVSLHIYTHPERVELQQNLWEDNTLILKWNIARGAQKYRVVICDEDNELLNDSPYLTDTDYLWKFNNSFFGNAYKAIIYAIGKNMMESKYDSELTILGGDKVPKQVTAKLAKDSESYKQAEIYWEEPTIKPQTYIIVAVPELGEEIESEPINGTNYLFDGLMAGTKYEFKVFSVDENSKRSLGSSSGTIETKPNPNMVKGVKISDRTEQGFCVIWNEMKMIEALGQIQYELKITTQMPFMEITRRTTDPQYYISGLCSGKKYSVKVRAINEKGIGEYSTKCLTMTEYGKPSDIIMKLSEPPASAIEIKFVQAPDEPSDYNIQILKVQRNRDMPILEGLLFNNNVEDTKKQRPSIKKQTWPMAYFCC